MSVCSSCGAEVVEGSRFCGECGAPTPMSSHPTIESPKGTEAFKPSSSPRFHPGQMFGGRYRIVAQLGRGGMGEVYRADDLKLGQAVAIKLLPSGLEQDPDLLERLRNEVRLSLRVTHPNVCRVFDIGEVDGRHFLSMEYVDGEDLASLLRRIGRLPEDKAIDVARQLCAGLAAAHDEGILHRDLKPANVMIDGRGRAKITDFGLAGATRGIEGAEAMAGTPGYLAPEQIEGGALTVATDIYALGIVLYELFTGERAFPGDSAVEIMSRQRSGTRPTVASGSKLLEPAVESVLMRCMEFDPAARPQTATAVAAALPGGDPLAAALAAGETPSPEMVAEAGGEGSLRPAVALSLLACVLSGLAALPFSPSNTLLSHIPLEKPPAELRVIARTIASEMGYTDDPVDRVYGFAREREYFDRVAEESTSPDRWDDLSSVRPAPLYFWYRESPEFFVPTLHLRGVTETEPPIEISAMLSIRLDPAGRLQSFSAVPPQFDDAASTWDKPDWESLFSRADLDFSQFETAIPQWAPLAATDIRRAWVAKQSDAVQSALRVEAASFRGKPIFFSVISPWSKPDRMADPEEKAFPVFFLIFETVIVLIIIGGILLARRNRRLGRSDGRGAMRLAVIFFVLEVAGFLFSGHHRPTPNELFQLFDACAWGLLRGAIAWILYTALEPYVRRLWPHLLIGWNRLLEGRWRDPFIGRQILIGAVVGLANLYVFNFLPILLTGLGTGSEAPWEWSDRLATAASWGRALGLMIDELVPPFLFPLWGTLLLILLLVVLRVKWLASVVFVVGLSLISLGFPGAQDLPVAVEFGMALLFWFWAWFVLTRFGLLVMMIMVVFAGWGRFVLGADPTSWHFPPVLLVLALLTAIAVFGFFTSLGGRALFRDVLSD